PGRRPDLPLVRRSRRRAVAARAGDDRSLQGDDRHPAEVRARLAHLQREPRQGLRHLPERLVNRRAIAAVVLASTLTTATAQAAEFEPNVLLDTIITGRGFGHGRGMS